MGVSQCNELNMLKSFISLSYVPILKEMLKQILCMHNVNTCFQSVRPLGSFLNSGKDLTWVDLASGVYKIPCSCGKFYSGRTHQQFIERFIEHRNSVEKTLKLRKPTETFFRLWLNIHSFI